MVDIVLSIKSEYAERILTGIKRFEFRKRRPKQRVCRVYIYACSPIKSVVGYFQLIKVLSGSPEEIWQKCGEQGGIEKEKFFSYFGSSKIAYGFEIGCIERFNPPIDPFEIKNDFKAPQSFAYLYDFGEKGLPM
jgi:type I restriction enzyme S subunit